MKQQSFKKCPTCGTPIEAVSSSQMPSELEPSAAADCDRTFELRDTRSGGGRMTFALRDVGELRSDGRPITPYLDITLSFPGQINATAGLATDISAPLIQFFETLASLDGDWCEERRIRDADRQFSIVVSFCYKGNVLLEVSLSAEFQDPAWTVELSLNLNQADLPSIVDSLRRFFAVV